jgi:hypothetical protein
LSLVTSDESSSSGLFKHVVNRVEEFNDKDKLVGQTYDGACIVSWHINWLQSKVIEAYPSAIFTHCYVHVLNLVLKQSLSNIKECRLFFHTISGLAAHLSKSSKRVNALQDFVAKKFLSVAPIRWNFTSRLTNSETSIEFFNTSWRILGNGTWKNELKVLFSSDEFVRKPVHHLLKFMQDTQLQVAFKEIYKLATLIVTIPSSTATVERSSSDVKRIHTCCRGTQTQERLCGLSLLAIEKTFIL